MGKVEATMIKPEHIPPEVVGAAAKAYELHIYDAVAEEGIRLAIAAALNAWPGVDLEDMVPPFYGIEIILPLTQEKSEEAKRIDTGGGA